MPIYSLEGTPGSGKTLYVVQKIIPDFLKIRDGRGDLVPRHIYTNVEGLRPELICAYCGVPYEAIAEYFHVLGQAVDENGRTYEDKDLVRWWFYKPESIEWIETRNANKQIEKIPNPDTAEQIENGSLVIIDEVQNYYSNRDFATAYSKACIDYITKNRHFGWTLWWMSQSVESVDVTFRRNTQYVYFLERKEIFGSDTSSSVKMYEGWLAGNKTNIPPFATSSFRFDKRYFNAYRSYVQGVTQEKRYKTNVFLQHKGFMAMVIIAVLCIVIIAVSHPLDTLSGKNAFASATPKKQASERATTPVSFSGAGVAPSENDPSEETNSLCALNYFVQNNKPFVVLRTENGFVTRQVREGSEYAECD